MAAQIRPTTWPELENNIPRLGYRFAAQVKQQMAAVKSIFHQGALQPYIAQVPNSPPLILIKGPLFAPNDIPQGAPPVEFVVTLSQEFPNAYPIITIELPPQGNIIKNHPNVNNQGCVFLQSISAWNPRTSQIDQCLKDLYIAFKNDYPFAPASAPPPPQAAPVQHPTMPQQTLAMGATITNMLASTAKPAPTQAPPPQPQQHFQQPSQQQLQQQHIPPPQQRPANVQPAYAQQPAYDFSKGDFEGMLAGAAKPPGTIIATPAGFGLGPLMASHVNLPMTLQGAAPFPLPPVLTPTPDEQYRQAVLQAEKERHGQPNQGGLGGLFNSVKGAATSAKNAVEDKVRDSIKNNDIERFNKLLPNMRHEHLMTTYACSTLVGNGTIRAGHVFVTNIGVHFTTKPTDPKPNDPPRPPEYTCSLPLRGIVSIVLGNEHGRKWIHLVCVDGTVRSLVDVKPGWTAYMSAASAALNDTPYDRLYNWLDHAWRAATPVPHPSYPYAGHGGSQLTAPPQISSPVQQQSASVSDDNLCCICMERQRNCFFRPCGHVSTCMVCGSQTKTCPICRSNVETTFQAFL